MCFKFEVEVEVERNEGKFASREEIAETLEELLAASAPYMTDCMPWEELFSGTDLRNFERFAAARQRAVRALSASREVVNEQRDR